MKLLDLIQNTPEWYEYRKNGIGGSEIAGVASIPGAYVSRSGIMREKLGQKQKAINSFTQRIFDSGHTWEQVARPHAEQLAGIPLPPAVVESDESPRFFASLDGWNPETKTTLEIKSTSKTDLYIDLMNGKVWGPWMAQVQWGLMCSGGSRSLLAGVLDATGEMIVHEIQPDLNMQALLVGVALDFLRELDLAKALITPERKINSMLHYKKAAAKAKQLAEIWEEEAKKAAESILSGAGLTRLETPKVIIAYQERQGSVAYKNIPELKGLDLEPYRGKPSKFITIKLKGESNE